MKQIFIEGNVGAGKSTLLSIIEDSLNVEVLYEPYALWQDVDGHNLLKRFFEDPKRWAFTLQTYVTTTQVELLQDTYQYQMRKKTVFFERSIYSGRYCFATNAHDTDLLDDTEWGVYTKTWDLQVKNIINEPTAFIYLRVPAKICFERIQKRNRLEEKPISLKYIEQLEQKYDDWLLHKKGLPQEVLDIPVFVLDGGQDFVNNIKIQKDVISKIEKFISSL